ncbi:hypothetical protein [Paenibacillus sp. R14(2021)]|uniref:hypothetical protein n=1 Tax=Paenibacillus sp. R14(2021) TaxID=2859228 RepID=UPI001C61493E|nr:hypothetical protein [Paenibacillus sp. R14(2021)]
MNREEAEALSAWLERSSAGIVSAYDITRISMDGLPLQGFHQWANGKPLVNAYHVKRLEGGALYLLFIDWHRNDSYYAVLYAGDKSTTHAEIRQLVYDDGGRPSHLKWTYNPLKRDGGNAIRKAFYKQKWGGTEVTFPVLGVLKEEETDLFLASLFEAVERRLQADRSPELFDEM